jgi:pyridoxamine 5'-phosphate oxidase
MVLVKGIDERGFRFFTNRDSRKGRELAENPLAAVAIHWHPLGRQVRAEGRVEPVGEPESLAYWRTRPRGSRLSASASPQSRVVESRAALEARVADLDARFPDDVPLPPFWGGYLLVPDSVELWEHRTDRLHDRVLYTRADGGWRRERLAP